ncbi:unnamed protein product [Gongylonema pulchrum]|uniref:Uncharacterized protein n=1 Tax=Gongylonema pulchrum TaxID=637853 RepID=A0A3P6SA93_9BILA|nr:unnamed protein product [Gongylonema pulchrum]
MSKAASTESLDGYDGPLLGQPGRPGTRDLEWTICRLNIRKQVYKYFIQYFYTTAAGAPAGRQLKGIMRGFDANEDYYLPVHSFSAYLLQPRHFLFQKPRDLFGQFWAPSLQESSAAAQAAAEALQKQLLASDMTRIFKPWKILSNVGLLTAFRDNPSKGVLLRSAIPTTPPTTPMRQKPSFIRTSHSVY